MIGPIRIRAVCHILRLHLKHPLRSVNICRPCSHYIRTGYCIVHYQRVCNGGLLMAPSSSECHLGPVLENDATSGPLKVQYMKLHLSHRCLCTWFEYCLDVSAVRVKRVV